MVIDVETLKKTYNAAINYHERALQFKDLGQRSSLIFNIGSVALENYLIALCELNGDPPANHDFVMLIEIVEKYMDLPPGLSEAIRLTNDNFGICSMDTYDVPNVYDSEAVLKICAQVSELFDPEKMKWIFNQKISGPFLKVE